MIFGMLRVLWSDHYRVYLVLHAASNEAFSSVDQPPVF